MSIRLIGISGKAGSGKDYVYSQYLKPLGYLNWSLAWHFKVWAVGKGTASHQEVFITKPPRVRTELQLEGTERGRNVYGEDVWCNTAEEWLNLLNEQWGCDKFVIPDVRFPNEVAFIKRLGGQIFRVQAPLRVGDSKLTADQRLHPSETALDSYAGFDGVIWNDPEHIDSVESQVRVLLAAPRHAAPVEYART